MNVGKLFCVETNEVSSQDSDGTGQWDGFERTDLLIRADSTGSMGKACLGTVTYCHRLIVSTMKGICVLLELC